MTTAHRATYKAAKGTEYQGGYKRWTASKMVSVLELPAYTKLKERRFEKPVLETDRNKENVKKLKSELLEKEKKHFKEHNKTDQLLMLEYDKKDEEIKKKQQIEEIDDSDEELESDSDDSDDEDEELIRQLEMIKKEKKLEKERINEEKKLEELKNTLNANPLLKQEEEEDTSNRTFSLKRKWNDYSIFRNQAVEPPKKKRKFINDTTRNDFHKQFLDSTIK